MNISLTLNLNSRRILQTYLPLSAYNQRAPRLPSCISFVEEMLKVWSQYLIGGHKPLHGVSSTHEKMFSNGVVLSSLTDTRVSRPFHLPGGQYWDRDHDHARPCPTIPGKELSTICRFRFHLLHEELLQHDVPQFL